jgi:hypothetical protein
VGAVVAVAVVVLAGAFSVPATAVSVDGTSISRATLNSDLATIEQNQAFACYLDASVAIRSGASASLPSVGGQGSSGTYNTTFVDFWLSQVVNNLLIEQLAQRQHLGLDATALGAGRSDLVSSITGTLEEAAASTGQSAVCAPSGQAVVASLPPAMQNELVRAQAAGDLVLAHAAGYGLGTSDLDRYFTGHTDQFRTICVSAIQTASESAAALARAAVEAGQSFAAIAKSSSTDAQSAANGGALGCFSATEGAYSTVASDVKGLAAGQVSQPISNNGTYLLLEVTGYVPADFSAVVPAVRQAILGVGSPKASSELTALTRTAQVSLDPRYGLWTGARGVGITPPATPPVADLLTASP